MAWFKFGKQDASAAQDAPVETVETMRSRAKRRLIGALVLVLTAVVGFPLLFDTQPRPALVDVPIEIPDKAKVKPLAPAAPTLPTTPATGAKVDDKASLGGKEEIVTAGVAGAAIAGAAAVAKEKIAEKQPVAGINTAPSATKSVAISAPVAPITPVAPAAPDKSAAEKAAAKAAADKAAADKAAAVKAAAEQAAVDKAAAAKVATEKTKADAARAQALLEGKATPAAGAAAGGERFIVQFGSFADESKAREVRQKVERAGLKTYAQIAETSEGKRHRARVGPFATRAEAEKAAAKIKSLDLPANILTL
jgi:DedD protein